MALTTSTDRLTADEVRSLAVARARIPRALAGGTRWLWELVTGAPSVAGENNVTPHNTDGQIGANRSGYPWGPAFRHHLWSTTGSIETNTGVAFGKSLLDEIATGSARAWVARFRVRPFVVRSLTPYSRGYLSIRVAAGTGAGTSSSRWRISRLDSPQVSQEATVTTSNTSPTAQGDIAYVGLSPGLNTVLISVDEVTTRNLRIFSLSLNQIVTRTH